MRFAVFAPIGDLDDEPLGQLAAISVACVEDAASFTWGQVADVPEGLLATVRVMGRGRRKARCDFQRRPVAVVYQVQVQMTL